MPSHIDQNIKHSKSGWIQNIYMNFAFKVVLYNPVCKRIILNLLLEATFL